MPPPTRIAVIDLGTNTFHLLVFEKTSDGTRQLYKEKIPVKIGEGGMDQKLITAEAKARALKALSHFANVMKEYGVEYSKTTATSAFRNASNSQEIIDEVRELTSIDILIIDGNLEAQLIYEGVSQAVSIPDTPSVIMDIGGGSVEYIICNNTEVLWKKSYEIGGLRLMTKYHQEDPIPAARVEELKAFLEKTLPELYKAVKKYNAKTLIGASGSFDTLVEIYHSRNGMIFSLDSRTEYKLPLRSFHKTNMQIIGMSRDERLRIPGMIEMRADMIVVACILIEELLDNSEINEILTSTYALKEGLLHRILNNEEIVA